jgi:hypothetical protein
MGDRVRRIRAEISRLRHGRPPTAVRYPNAIRQQVTAIARRLRADGANVPAIAREIGVAPWTLALWLRTPAPAVIRAVEVVPDAPRSSPAPVADAVLITREGIRVEGLDRDTLVAVLRALG